MPLSFPHACGHWLTDGLHLLVSWLNAKTGRHRRQANSTEQRGLSLFFAASL
jgi:hypothetical protein